MTLGNRPNDDKQNVKYHYTSNETFHFLWPYVEMEIHNAMWCLLKGESISFA